MLLLQMIKGNLEIWQWVLLLMVLVPISIKDIRTKRINGAIVIVAILVAIKCRLKLDDERDLEILLSFLPGAFLYVLSMATREKIGKGDALLVSFIGSVCGLRFSIVMLLLSFIVSSVTALVLLVMKKATKNTEMPFAPFLSIGVLAGGLI